MSSYFTCDAEIRHLPPALAVGIVVGDLPGFVGTHCLRPIQWYECVVLRAFVVHAPCVGVVVRHRRKAQLQVVQLQRCIPVAVVPPLRLMQWTLRVRM